MDSVPESFLIKLKGFNDSMKQFEDTLDEFLAAPYAEQERRPPLEKARFDLTALFAVNSLYWAYQACGGKHPKDQEDLAVELKRVKEYMGRLKKFDDLHLRPQVNARGARAFVRNALFDVHADESPMQERGRKRPTENEDWNQSSTDDNSTGGVSTKKTRKSDKK